MKKFKKLFSKIAIASTTTSALLMSLALLELPFWAWCLIIISPIILGLIIGVAIFFIWKKKRSKDYTSNPSQSRVETFIKSRK